MDHEQEKQPMDDSHAPKVLGMLAEFNTPDEVVAAATRVREEGYEHFDAHSPYPIHALDDAIGIKQTIIPWCVLGAGLTGLAIAVGMQWWTNAVDYKFIISGKPMFSLPANVPIMFELTVLLAALTAFFTNMIFNKMGRPHNKLHGMEMFKGCSDDRFYISIEARGYKFDEVETKKLLESLGATKVEAIMETEAERASKLPRPIVLGVVSMASLAFIPILILFDMRVGTFDKPRIHLIPDMDYQAYYKAQATNDFFADGRSARPQIEGTVALGQLYEDTALHYGKDSEGEWVNEFPIPVTMEMMERGQRQYRVTCVLCHGESGIGDGVIANRADRLMGAGASGMTWVPPSSLHDKAVIEQPLGQLYDSITNGVRNMSGYRDQLSDEDRWAILLYVRAIQNARSATMDDVPAGDRDKVRASMENGK